MHCNAPFHANNFSVRGHGPLRHGEGTPPPRPYSLVAFGASCPPSLASSTNTTLVITYWLFGSLLVGTRAHKQIILLWLRLYRTVLSTRRYLHSCIFNW